MLTQNEADFLRTLEKEFESGEVLPFALSRAFDLERNLLSTDRREKFIDFLNFCHVNPATIPGIQIVI